MGAGTDTSYTEAVIYENTISEVNQMCIRDRHNTCRKRVEQLIIESRPFVLYLYVITNLLFHLILLSKT